MTQYNLFIVNRENGYSKCVFCNTSTSYRLKDDKSFIVCDECQQKYDLFTKSYCMDTLLLNKNDLDALKCFHKSNQKLYLKDDIQKLIAIKYGDDYKNYKEKKLLQKYKRISNINSRREERKKNLVEKLADYKIECKNYGDCYTYIQFGYPDIDVVVTNELEKYKNIFSKQQLEANLHFFCILNNNEYCYGIEEINDDNTISF